MAWPPKTTMIATTNVQGPLHDVLFPHDEGSRVETYAILDGAACEGLLNQLDEHAPAYCCLYAGDLDSDLEEAAPHLVLLEEGHPFTEWLLYAIGERPWGIFCRAPATLREMRKHFRQFLLVKGPEGENLYFRYYDPRVLPTFLPTCETPELVEFFGPVLRYFTLSGEQTLLSFVLASGKLQSSVLSLPSSS